MALQTRSAKTRVIIYNFASTAKKSNLYPSNIDLRVKGSRDPNLSSDADIKTQNWLCQNESSPVGMINMNQSIYSYCRLQLSKAPHQRSVLRRRESPKTTAEKRLLTMVANVKTLTLFFPIPLLTPDGSTKCSVQRRSSFVADLMT